MTYKEKVLKVWPNAVAIQTEANSEQESYWWIYCGDHLLGADEERLGRGETEEAAWQNAVDLKPWIDQAVDLLNLYHSGYCPKDVAKDFIDKCRENFRNVTEYRPFGFPH